MSELNSVQPPYTKLKVWKDQGYVNFEPIPFQHINWAFEYLGVPLKVNKDSPPQAFMFKCLYEAACDFVSKTEGS